MKDITILQENIEINLKECDVLQLVDDLISFIASYDLQEELVGDLGLEYDISIVENEV